MVKCLKIDKFSVHRSVCVLTIRTRNSILALGQSKYSIVLSSTAFSLYLAHYIIGLPFGNARMLQVPYIPDHIIFVSVCAFLSNCWTKLKE